MRNDSRSEALNDGSHFLEGDSGVIPGDGGESHLVFRPQLPQPMEVGGDDAGDFPVSPRDGLAQDDDGLTVARYLYGPANHPF